MSKERKHWRGTLENEASFPCISCFKVEEITTLPPYSLSSVHSHHHPNTDGELFHIVFFVVSLCKEFYQGGLVTFRASGVSIFKGLCSCSIWMWFLVSYSQFSFFSIFAILSTRFAPHFWILADLFPAAFSLTLSNFGRKLT